MTTLTTHVLDTSLGRPAAGVRIFLDGDSATGAVEAVTDADGRATLGEVAAGPHSLRFDTGDWFAAQGVGAFYPEVVVTFTVDGDEHLHVPLLLSPFGYSTYRGS